MEAAMTIAVWVVVWVATLFLVWGALKIAIYFTKEDK